MSIKLPQQRRRDIVAWLHGNVEPNHCRSNTADALSPWHVAVVAQIATWRGVSHRWTVTQSRQSGHVVIIEADSDIEILLGLMFSQAAS